MAGDAKAQEWSKTPIASLQAPLDKINGRILAAPVYTLNSSRKRKRAEISTAIDGEGIHIHGIRDPRRVTSYPVPPQTYFQAPPCTFCQKAKHSRPVIRHSYAATTLSPTSANVPYRPSLLHFAEPMKQSDSTPATQHKLPLDPDNGRVLSVDVLPHVGGAADTDGHDMIVLYEDGGLESFDANLKSRQWKKHLPEVLVDRPSHVVKLAVEFCALTDASQARKGLLRGREDALAKLGFGGDDDDSSPVNSMLLILVESRQTGADASISRFVHFLALQQRSIDGLTSSAPPVTHLLTWDLSALQSDEIATKTVTAKYRLDTSAGLLHQLLDDRVTTFDMTGLLPKIASTLRLHGSHAEDFIDLSPTNLLVMSLDASTVYDIKYNTVQATQPLIGTSNAVLATKKRKRHSDIIATSLSLLAYLPSAGIVAGLQGVDLVSLQVGDEYRVESRPGGTPTLLIDALSKGSGQVRRFRSEAGTDMKLPKFVEKSRQRDDDASLPFSEELNSSLEAAFAASDVHLFENLFASAVGITIPGQNDDVKRKRQLNGHHKQVSAANPPDTYGNEGFTREERRAPSVQYTWPTDRLAAPKPQHVRHQALYALGKIFSLSASNLGIDFFPPNVFRWLVANNFITPEMIGQAILRQDTGSTMLEPRSSPEIASALVDADPSTQALFTLITESSYLDILLLIRAIKIYIQSHTGPSASSSGRKALHAPPPALNGDSMDLTEEDDDVDALLGRADDDIAQAESILDDTFELRTIGLKHALIKLYVFPRTEVTQKLRQELSAHEIRFLIHILRIELQDGGWVSRYLDAGPTNLQLVQHPAGADEPDQTSRSPGDSAVTIVACLLSCCVDAIGIGGWIVTSISSSYDRSPSLAGTPDDLDPHELINLMYSETFAVLEGLHEVNFINNAITDFLRYADRLRLSQPPPNEALRNKKTRAEGGMTRPVTLVKVGNEGSEDAAHRLKAAIPMGGKVPEGERRVEATKVKSGGEVKVKSKREIGMEISKRVGRYSFERIRV